VHRENAVPFWQRPFGYAHALVIIASLTVVGFLLELVTTLLPWRSSGQGVRVPPFPYNLIFLLGFVAGVISLRLMPGPRRISDGLVRIPFAVVASIALALLVVIPGVFPGELVRATVFGRFGLGHVTQSWPYALLVLVICASLLSVAVKKVRMRSWQQWPSMLNHGGLFIILAAGSMSAGDYRSLRLAAYLDRPVTTAYREADRRVVASPLQFRLDRFVLEYYPPKLVFFDEHGRIVNRKRSRGRWDVAPGEHYSFRQYRVSVRHYLPHAVMDKTRGRPVARQGGQPYAKLAVSGGEEGEAPLQGWVTLAHAADRRSFLALNGVRVALQRGGHKRYASHITMADGRKRIVEVNRPLRVDGWTLYQYGYDTKAGVRSRYSVIQAVHDPWLPVVYSGFVCLIAGVCGMVWQRRRLLGTGGRI